MKTLFKIALSVLLLISVITVHSQEAKLTKSEAPEKQKRKPIKQRKNELKIDAFDLSFLSALDLSYERITRNEFSYGFSVLVNFDNTIAYNEDFAFTPFFRMYFFSDESYGAKGFFAELFGKFAAGTQREFNFLFDTTDFKQHYFEAGLGIVVGHKWVHDNGFTVELSLGGGRSLGFSENSPQQLYRGGISMGYRF